MKKNTQPTAREDEKVIPATQPQPTPKAEEIPRAKVSPEAGEPSETDAPAENEQPQETTPPPSPAPLPDDFEARIAEAETRGYLRGRNERIAELMREPAIYERQAAPAGRSTKDEDWQGESQPMILNNPRVSIWDK